MPPWEDRLGEAQVRAVAAYVHGLGGGEAQVEEEAPTETGAVADEPGIVPAAD